MRGLVRHTACVLLSAGLLLPLPGLAQEAQGGEESIPEYSGEESLFKLEYKIDDRSPMTVEVTEDDPFTPFLTILKQSADVASKKKVKPGETATTVNLIAPEITEVLGKIPPLNIHTKMTADGSGNSQFDLPAFKREVEEDGQKGKLDWQGLSGAVSYVDPQLTAPKGEFKLAGLNLQIEPDMGMQFKNLTLSGALDADGIPEKLHFDLPEFILNSDEGDMSLNGVLLDADVFEARPDLKLGKGMLRINNFTFQEGESQARLKNFSMSGGAALAGEVINYTLDLDVDEFFLPKGLSPEIKEDTQLAYTSKLEFRNIDAAAIADIQKTARELQQQQSSGAISEDMVGIVLMGKMMESLPKLWQKSPELALNNLKLDTSAGKLNGNLQIKVDGTRPMQLENPEALKKALSGQADFSLDKSLLQKVTEMQIRDSLPPPAAGAEGEAPQGPSDEQIQQMVEAQIQALVQQKFLVPEGESYRLKAEFKEGRLLVNGKDVPLPM